MQVYAMKFHNFLRFGETNNTIVFDLTNQQKRALANGETTMDAIYAEVVDDPIGHINRAKKRGLEEQIGIIGLVDGDPDSSNGVGKSSIMEGICYSHYEKIVRKTANSDKIEKAGLSVVTKLDGKYPKDLRESYVEEYLEDNGLVYRIKRGRTFSKTHKSSQPVLDFECIGKNEVDRRTSHRTSDTKESIADVITMDYDVFVNSQMFGQSDAGKYLTGTDKVKKEMLISLLRLENVVVGCLELLRKKKNDQDKKVSSIKSNIEFLENMIYKSYMKYCGDDLKTPPAQLNPEFTANMPDQLIEKLKAIRQKGKTKIDKCDKRSTEVQEEIDLLSKSEKLTTVARIKEEGKRVKVEKEAKLKENKQRLADWDKLKQSAISEVKRVTSEIEIKTERIAKANEEIVSVEKKLASFDLENCKKKLKVIAKAKKEKPSLEKELAENVDKREEIIKYLAGMKTRITGLQDEIKALQSQIDNVQDGEDFICDKCRSKVPKEHILTEISDSQEIVDTLTNTLGGSINAKSERETKISDLQAKIAKVDKYVLAEATINGEIETNKAVQEKLKALQASKEEFKLEIVELQQRFKDAEGKRTEYVMKVAEINLKTEAAIKDIETRIENLREDFVKAKKDAKVVEEKIVELKGLLDKISKVKTETSEKLGFIDREISHHNQLKTTLGEKRIEYKEESKTLNRYLLLESIYGLDGIQTRIVKKYLPLLNIYIKEFLDVLSRGTIEVQMVVNEKSKIDMVISGASADSYEMLSGGEKMIVRLAVDIGLALLSFSRSSQKPEIICLDEIFGCLDVEHTENVFKMLEKLQEKFSRVIIISHDKEVCQKLDSKIVIEKGSGNMGLSKILRIE